MYDDEDEDWVHFQPMKKRCVPAEKACLFYTSKHRRLGTNSRSIIVVWGLTLLKDAAIFKLREIATMCKSP